MTVFLRRLKKNEALQLGAARGDHKNMNSFPKSTVAGLVGRQLMLGLTVSTLLFQALVADEHENVSDAEACRKIADKSERLLCYDTVADGGVFNEQQAQQARVDSFGGKEKQPESSIDQLAVTIVKVQKAGNRIHYFQTADGTVWKQTSASSWKLDVPFQATIKAGVLSSFFLVAEGGKSTRVKRVK
jgi:hypothetical protein